jgi:putative transposase
LKFDPNNHHRRSIRLKGYDYTQPGAYFVTMVTFRRECLFGEVIGGEMVLNPWGSVVDECWRAIPNHFPNVELGAYVVMPNHIHGIVVIREMGLSVGTRHASPLPSNPPRGVIPNFLGAIVGSVKSAVTRVWDVNSVHPISGRAIITNISFETKKICLGSMITLNQTP